MMALPVNEYEYNLDLKFKTGGERLEFQQNSINTCKIRFRLTDEFEPINITGMTILADYESNNGHFSATTSTLDEISLINIINATQGEFDLIIASSVLQQKGKIKLQIKLVGYSGVSVFPAISISVKEGVNNEEEIQATNDFPLVMGAINSANNLIRTTQEIIEQENARIGRENIREANELMRAELTNHLNDMLPVLEDATEKEPVRQQNEINRINSFNVIKNQYQTALDNSALLGVGDLSSIPENDVVEAILNDRHEMGDIENRVDTIEDKIIELKGCVYNVKDYGLKGDGVTDDSIKFSEMINQISRGIIYFPEGTYIIENITIANKKDLIFISGGATITNKTNTTAYIWYFDNVADIYITYFKFQFVVNPSTYSSTNGLMIKTERYKNVIIDKCVFRDIACHAIYADKALDDEGVASGTTSANITISKCTFRNQTALNNPAKQSAIYLGADGEYAKIIFSEFRKCQTVIQGYGGANALFEGNTVMSCQAPFANDSALIYFASPSTSGVNSAKVIITNNEINHNTSGIDLIRCVGNDSRSERRFTITNNHMLVNGTATNSRGVVLVNADYSIFTGNYVATNASANINQTCITLDSCNYVTVDNNTFQYSSGISLINSSRVILGSNKMKLPLSGATLTIVESGSQIIPSSGVYSFRFKDTGLIGAETDNPTWTLVRNSTGVYTLTHNLGHIFYVITCTADNTTTPYIFAVKRDANNAEIRTYNLQGTLEDANIMGVLKVNSAEL